MKEHRPNGLAIHEKSDGIKTQQANTRMTRRGIFTAIGSMIPVLVAPSLVARGQDKSAFPDGYDAAEAAPGSHKVIFENNLVRVLEVIVPSPGHTEPMHHHRWLGFFLSWDKGGKSPHVRYIRPGGSIRDEPNVDRPVQRGKWAIQWMQPEPMHAIEVIDRPQNIPGNPPLLRVEIKCGT